MSTLGLQDVFEPYYEGRKNCFATIEPSAVERARKIEALRRGRLNSARTIRPPASLYPSKIIVVGRPASGPVLPNLLRLGRSAEYPDFNQNPQAPRKSELSS
jgi:hypothetical protein